MASTIAGIRNVEAALGDSEKTIRESEIPTLGLARRSLYARVDIAAGETLTNDNIMVRRPQHSVTADQLDAVLDCSSTCDIAAGSPIAPEHFTV